MKILNLAYDNWEDGQELPKPNCVNIYGEGTFWDGYQLINHYLDRGLAYSDLENVIEEHEKFTTKRCKMSEVEERPNENFYYVINHFKIELTRLFIDTPIFGEEIPALLNGERPLSDIVIKYLKERNNFFLIFMTEHECDTERGYELTVKYIKSLGIDLEKLYIVNNNAKIDWLKKIHGDFKVKEHGLEFIPSSSTKVLERIGSTYKKEKEGKFFLCHNKSPKPHRYAMLMLLKKSGILEKDVNWSLVPPYYNFPIGNFYHSILDDNCLDILDEEVQYFNEIKLKTSDYEGDEGWFKPLSEINRESLPYWQQIPEKNKTFEESYVNIVTESLFSESPNVVQITEKSFRPFFFYQLPIIVASPHHISIMKQRYGFDFFEDIIDHNYDDKMNDTQRFFLIYKEIKRLYQNKDKVIEFYQNNYERLEANKQRVLDILKIKRDYMFFSNLTNITNR
jgi:hypothetical protein